ncbi:MAG: acyl-CoA/acyl-ACP dehydrogenase [Spirochaetia bacterium]|jgi:alkylation response protein AidB-like acyl-CoA dehydrogenase|nr:acyl-CoA/acyl-ACP dehydrogenase [Spirochaetia bacterium]
MDFEFNNEQRDIQKAVREFAEAEMSREYMLELDRTSTYPADLLKKACDLGFLCIDIPEKYGGVGYGLTEKAIVFEELCRMGAGVGMSLGGSCFGLKVLLNSGTEEQKNRILPRACSGEGLPFSGAFTEPDKGTDIVTFPLGTTAVRKGGKYIINGTKTFITHADISKYVILLCQTDTNAKPSYKGQTTFILENPLDKPGYTVSSFEKMGWQTSHTTQISFSDFELPAENIVGKENQGFYNVMSFLTEFRIETAAAGVGMAQGVYEKAVNYAKTREAFGQKIGKFQSISHKIADMATKIETARLLLYKAAAIFDTKHDVPPHISSMAKWYGARMAVEVADDAMEIFGGHGYIIENDVARFYRDTRMLELVEGTREAQKNTIAASILGRLD